VASDDDPSGRSVSRGIVLLDHAQRDGMEGFITITGGKLMTYRLMAEWATDAVCRKLGNTALYNRRCAAARLAGADGNHATQNHLFTGRCAVGHLPPRRSHPRLAWR
jgi:glycerol-3-phosphate dehydrogenase